MTLHVSSNKICLVKLSRLIKHYNPCEIIYFVMSCIFSAEVNYIFIKSEINLYFLSQTFIMLEDIFQKPFTLISIFY